MYSDVQEIYDGGAADLEQELRCAADGAASSASNSSNAPQGTAQRQGSSSSSSSDISGSTLTPNSTPGPSGGGGSQSGSISTVDTDPGPQVTNRFVLLCVNGPRFPQLRQIPLASQQVSIASHDNDRILFDNIRSAYIEVRRSYQPSFHPETPAVVKIFVGWMYRVWNASQKLTTEVFKMLRLRWLVWWIGDDVFFVPKSADFVKVGPVQLAPLSSLSYPHSPTLTLLPSLSYPPYPTLPILPSPPLSFPVPLSSLSIPSVSISLTQV